MHPSRNYTRFSLLLAPALVLLLFLSSFQDKEETRVTPAVSLLDKTILIPGMITKTDAVSGAVQSLVIPLRRAGKLFLIEAKIDDQTGNFIFDTGASGIVLNSTYFRRYFTTANDGGGITGGSGKIGRTIVKWIQIPGMSYENITADVADLSHLENRRGVKVLGLFGISLLKNCEIIIDFNRNELYLYGLDKTGKRLDTRDPEFRADMVQKIEVYHDVMFMKATIGGKVLNFCLDTGAESNVISSSAPKKILNSLTILRRSDLLGVGKATSDALLCSLNDLSVGGRKLPEMNAIIADLGDMSAFFGYAVDGMLGYDFFGMGKVSVNLRSHEIKFSFDKTGTK
jgi:predicted aspartyl protease